MACAQPLRWACEYPEPALAAASDARVPTIHQVPYRNTYASVIDFCRALLARYRGRQPLRADAQPPDGSVDCTPRRAVRRRDRVTVGFHRAALVVLLGHLAPPTGLVTPCTARRPDVRSSTALQRRHASRRFRCPFMLSPARRCGECCLTSTDGLFGTFRRAAAHHSGRLSDAAGEFRRPSVWFRAPPDHGPCPSTARANPRNAALRSWDPGGAGFDLRRRLRQPYPAVVVDREDHRQRGEDRATHHIPGTA